MNHSIADIAPEFYGIYYYNYTKNTPWKSHYPYRYIYITDGKACVEIAGKEYKCEKENIVYMLPGENYNFRLTDGKFALINLFFDFFPYHHNNRDGRERHCVFETDFKSEFCSDRINFTDAPYLNSSGVFDVSATSCRTYFETMLKCDKLLLSSALYLKAAIIHITQEIVFSKEDTVSKNDTQYAADRILEYIDANPDKIDSVSTLARIFRYHENYINFLVKKRTGMNVSSYIKLKKISLAKQLIENTDLPLSEIAAELGYYDTSHFYRAYKSVTGFAPKKNNLK